MTSPNEVTPYSFLSSTGLGAFAAKNQEDWELEQRTAFTSAFSDAETGFGVIRDWIDTLIGLLTEQAQEILTDLFEFFGDIFDGAGSVVTWLEGLGSAVLSAALTEFDTFLSGITSRTAWLATFKTLIDGLLGITGFQNWVTVFKKVIDALVGVTGIDSWLGTFTDVIDFFVTLIGSLGSGVFTVIEEIVEFFDGIFSGAGSIGTWLTDVPANLLSVIETITGLAVTTFEDGLGKLVTFTQSLPNVGGLISGLLGSYINPVTGTNNTLVDLVAWASRLLTVGSVVPSFNLIGSIPADLLALIGVGNIGNVAPNLVTDAGFGSAAAFQAGAGWSWDSTQNSTGSTGGAAKLTCDGGVKYLFSNLIAVAPGQELTLSTKSRYTKGATAAATIIIGVRTYDGETVKATQTVTAFTATGTTSVGISGADAAGFRTVSGTFTVPAATTHVRLVLGVTVGTSGTLVWFDDASLRKGQLLPQTLVNNLPTTLSTLLPDSEFRTLLNTVANRTGATVAQVQAVINGKLTASSPLNGSNINVGNISSAVISELVATWTRIYSGLSGGTAPPANTIDFAGISLNSLRDNVVSLSSSLSGVANSVSTLNSRADSVLATVNAQNKVLTDYATEVNAKLAALGATPPGAVTPPVAPPIIISARDEFERTDLGIGTLWNVTQRTNTGATLGIPDGSNANYNIPGPSISGNQVAAVWNGTNRVSVSEYQRISATLGSKASIPLVGTQGFNDLLGRAVSGTTCLVCRFFPDGRVQFLYRLGNWTEQILGSFTVPTQPTSGTLIEFSVGEKSLSDQTRLTAKVNNTTVGPAFVSAGILASMGKGWGFGMGHGLSGLAPQASGNLNYWLAQEQP